MDSNIFSLITTKSDIDTIMGEIDILSDSLFRTGEADFEHTLKSKIRLTTAKFFESRKEELDTIKSQLISARIVKLTLAFEAKTADAEKILAWLRKNIDPNCVLDLAHDKNLLGGAIIEFEGKYIDMSLRKQMEALGL